MSATTVTTVMPVTASVDSLKARVAALARYRQSDDFTLREARDALEAAKVEQKILDLVGRVRLDPRRALALAVPLLEAAVRIPDPQSTEELLLLLAEGVRP